MEIRMRKTISIGIFSAFVLVAINTLVEINHKQNNSIPLAYDLGDKFVGLPSSELEDRAAYFGDSVDIDADGLPEVVFYTVKYMTNRPHMAFIVDDGVIVFRSKEGAKLKITETEDKKGFYLHELVFDEKTREVDKSTKYIKHGDGFTSE